MPSADAVCMRQLQSVAALLLCAWLPGCLEYEQTVTIAADGSGTQSVRLAMSDAVVGEVKRAAAMAPSGSQDPLLVFDKVAVDKELAAAGLQLDAHATKQLGNKRQVDLQASFKTLGALRQSPLCGSLSVWEFSAGPKPGTICATFYPQGKEAWSDAALKAERMKGQTDAVAATFFQKRQQQIAGLDLTFKLTVPGNILVHTRNLEKTGDREVTARITAEQIKTPEDLVRRLAPRYQVIFESRGCTFALDGK
jgi:hypothetical protein